jgi:ABC-type lipoprotein release transport system permease subunit
MIISLGWKNVWRNKTRSLVVIIAVMLGIFGGVMATGIMQGWIRQRIYDGIHKEISHIQIHNPAYMYNEDIAHTLVNYEHLAAYLDTMEGVVAYSPRVKLYAMARNSWAASGFMIKGIDPEKENRVSEIHAGIIEGGFFEGDHRIPSIVISKSTAENLKLLNYQITEEKLEQIDTVVFPRELIHKIKSVGQKRYRTEKAFKKSLDEILNKEEQREYISKLVKYFSFLRMGSSIELTLQDVDGHLIHPVFKLRGVYKTDNSAFDAMNAFVERDALNKYTLLTNDQVHEIAIMASDTDVAVDLAARLSEALPEQDVLSWRKLSPEIAMYIDFAGVMGYIYVGIILLALAFGIINTMLMSVLERVKELGMLMAIGMNKKRVFSMIMIESVFLSLTGAAAGMVFSGIIVKILSRTGINFDMWSEGFEALGYAAIVYPFVTWQNYLVITTMVILTGIIAALWPARKALRLNPVEALRTE